MTTKDFYLSSYLVASGFRLAGHTRQADITMFRFNDTDDLNHAVQQFYGLTAMVEPMSHGHAMRTLKSIIHSNENDKQHEPTKKVYQLISKR